MGIGFGTIAGGMLGQVGGGLGGALTGGAIGYGADKSGLTDKLGLSLDRSKGAAALADSEIAGNRNPGAIEGYRRRQSDYYNKSDAAARRRAPSAGKSAFRADQRQQINRLTDMAEGRGPSLAALQARDSLQRGVSAQQALAAGARPGQQAGAARMASQQGSLLAGSVAGASAQARAQEQLGAMNQLTGAIQGARGQDQSRNLANLEARLRQTGMNDAQVRAMLELEQKQALAAQLGQLEQAGLRQGYYQLGMGQPTGGERLLGAIEGGIGAGTQVVGAAVGGPAGAGLLSRGGGGGGMTSSANTSLPPGYYNSQAPGTYS